MCVFLLIHTVSYAHEWPGQMAIFRYEDRHVVAYFVEEQAILLRCYFLVDFVPRGVVFINQGIREYVVLQFPITDPMPVGCFVLSGASYPKPFVPLNERIRYLYFGLPIIKSLNFSEIERTIV